jgi:hypothetical protein
VGVREDYELRDGASPSALERCAISADLHGCKLGASQETEDPELVYLRAG